MCFSCINGIFFLPFEFQKDKELYFESSRVGSADTGSLLCRLVSGNMNPKTLQNIQEKFLQGSFSKSSGLHNHTFVYDV